MSTQSIVHECIYVAHLQILNSLILCLRMYASPLHMKYSSTYIHTNKSHVMFTCVNVNVQYHNVYRCVHVCIFHCTSTQGMNVHNNIMSSILYSS